MPRPGKGAAIRAPVTASVKAAREAKRRAEWSKALDLRIKGSTYEQIGEALNICTSSAQNYVTWALQGRKLDTSTDLAKLESDRLDRVLRGQWDKIENGDTRAAMAAVSISKRRSELFGLDAPTRSQVTVSQEMTEAEADRLLAEIAAAKREPQALTQGEVTDAEFEPSEGVKR